MVYHHIAKMGQYFPIQKHIQNNQQICQSCTSQVITYMYAKILWHNKIRDNQKEIGILMGIGFNNKDIIFIYLFSMLCMILFSFLMTLAIIYLGVHIANLLLQTKPFVNTVFFNVDLLTYLTISLAGLIIAISSLIPLLTLSNKKPIDIIKNK